MYRLLLLNCFYPIVSSLHHSLLIILSIMNKGNLSLLSKYPILDHRKMEFQIWCYQKHFLLYVKLICINLLLFSLTYLQHLRQMYLEYNLLLSINHFYFLLIIHYLLLLIQLIIHSQYVILHPNHLFIIYQLSNGKF